MKRPKVSGLHSSPRRILSATEEQWDRWTKAAAALGMTWADWVRGLQDKATPKDFKKKP